MIRSKAAREASHRGHDAFAARALGGHRDRSMRAAIAAARRATDPDDVGRRAALDREHGRPERQRGRRPEERDRACRRRSGRDRRRARPRCRRGAPRAARGAPRADPRSGRRPRRASARTRPGAPASSTVSMGATAPPTRAARKSAGSSIAPKCSPTNSTARPGANASTTISGVSTSRAGGPGRPGEGPASAPPRGSSGRCAGTRNGRGARARAGPWRRPGPAGCPAPEAVQRATHPPEVAPRLCGALRREPVPERRPRAPPARVSGPSGQAAGEPRRGDQRARPGSGASREATPPWPGVGHHGRSVRLARPTGIRAAPACISARSALEIGGLGVGRRPDRLEAVPLLGRVADRSSPARRPWPGWRVGARPGRPARRRSASAQVTSNRPSGCAADGDRQDPRTGLGGEGRRARPAGSSRRRTAGPGSRRCGSPSRPAGPASRGGGARRRSPAGSATAMTFTPHYSRCRRSSSKSSGKDESSATTLIGRPWRAIAAATASLLPTWPTARIRPPSSGRRARSA